jgi:enoyl-CoA hydratase/carnithine racemase
MAEDLVLYETDEKVSIITLNRPEKLNAISPQLRLDLVDAFVRAEDDPDTWVVVLRANGRSFCVGYDIGGSAEPREWRYDTLRWHAYLGDLLEFEMMPWYLSKPVVASVHGHALGGGCELAMFCDLTIAADNCLFGEPEARFCETGPAVVMPWIIGFKRARELLYFGDMIDAPHALELGMINKVVPLDELSAATLAYAKRLSLIGPETLTATKHAVNRGADASGFRAALQSGVDVLAPLYASNTEVNSRFEALVREQGLGAALKWRKAQFEQ